MSNILEYTAKDTIGTIEGTIYQSNGSPLDITAYTIKLQLLYTPVVEKTASIVSGPAGTFTIDLDESDISEGPIDAKMKLDNGAGTITYLDTTIDNRTFVITKKNCITLKIVGSYSISLIGPLGSGGADHDAVTLAASATPILGITAGQELSCDTQVKNTVLAGPTTGADAAPTFRALIADDVPDLSGTYITKATLDGYTILCANVDDTPIALGVSEGTVVGRRAGGNISAISNADLKSDLSLNNVENTALSTWAGSANIITLGIITTGTWSGTAIAVAKGGTALTSVAAGSIIAANSANTFTEITSTSGTYYLKNVDGTISWAAGGGGASALDDLSDVTITSVERGDVLFRNATGWVNLHHGSAGQVLTSGGDGADASWTTVAGTGDVVGPSSSTDNAIARFNTTTGKLIKNSVVSIAETTGTITTSGTGNLGSTGAYWDNIYANKLYLGSSAYFSSSSSVNILTTATLIAPSADGGSSLGSAALTWLNSYVVHSYVDDITLVGSTTSTSGYLQGINVSYNASPASSSTADVRGIGGFAYVTTANFGEAFIKGLYFGSGSVTSGAVGSATLTGMGVDTFGGAVANLMGAPALTYRSVIGVHSMPAVNLYGGAPPATLASLTATDAYGIYISDSVVAVNGTLSLTNQILLAIETPTAGATDYQMVLEGSGAGTGIWFNVDLTAATYAFSLGSDYCRIYCDAADSLILASGTATMIKYNATQIGFFNVGPASRATAYTQTYSTANKTHSNITAVDPGSYSGGSYGYNSAAQAQAVYNAVEAIIVDVANVKQVLNSVIDDLQAYGLLQ